MDELRNSVPEIIPKAFFNVINLLESDTSQFTRKFHRNLESVSLMVTYVPAQSQVSLDTEGIPGPSMPLDEVKSAKAVRVKKARKKKSQLTIARDRARRQQYRKVKTAKKASKLGNTTGITSSVKDPKPPPQGQPDFKGEKPGQLERSDLEKRTCAGQTLEPKDQEHEQRIEDGTHSNTNEESTEDSSYEEELRILHRFSKASDDKTDSEQDYCSYSRKRDPVQELKCYSACKGPRYCSRQCQISHWPAHKTACKAIQAVHSK